MKTTLCLAALLLAWSLAPLAAADPDPTLVCIDESGDCVVEIQCVVNPCQPLTVCVANRLVCVPPGPEP